MSEPDLVILDESLAALDPASRRLAKRDGYRWRTNLAR
jgi:ABC-type multidrug transport system ATPase subunit